MFNTFRYTCKGKIQKIKELKMQTPWRACRGSASCLPARADRTVSSQGMSETFVGTYDFSNRAGRHEALPLHARQGVCIFKSSNF